MWIDSWKSKLEQLTVKHRVPGATLAIFFDGALHEAAVGILNQDTGVEATVDSLFQIGSVAKLYTATLVMRLVDEQSITLDTPIRKYIPELELSDPRACEVLTVRHLLSHTSGVDGDFFVDFGWGDDRIARYVAACAALPHLFPPGMMYSYSNTAYVILGRLIERLTNRTWDRAIRELLLDPLGMLKTVTRPDEALLSRVAVGHYEREGTSAPIVVSPWTFPACLAPAGTTMCAPAREVITFSRMHLQCKTEARERLPLSGETLRLMQELHAPFPGGQGGQGAGLGWHLYEWGGYRALGHDGIGKAQLAYLRVVPDLDLAIVLLTNAGGGAAVWRELTKELGAALLGITSAPRPEAEREAQPDLDLSSYAGTYEHYGRQLNVQVGSTGLTVTPIYTNETVAFAASILDGPKPSKPLTLSPRNASHFVATEGGTNRRWPMLFLDFDIHGRPHYLHSFARVARRADDC